MVRPPPKRPARGTTLEPAVEAPKYSIRVTSRLTAIELATLRMWERRYGFPRPERGSGGSRFYSEADIEALKIIKRALEHGYRPGEVVGKPLAELTELVRVASAAPARSGARAPTTDSIIEALARDEISELRAELRNAAVMLGAKRFLAEVAHPVCVRVGELWAEGKLEVRHEHLLTECLIAQLRVLTSGYEEHASAPRVLLSTLPNERHGLGLAMVEAFLAASGVTPIFLGVDTPPEQIVKAAWRYAVDAVGLLVTEASDPKVTKNHIRGMLAELPRHVPIWIGGAGGPHLGLKDEAVRIIRTWDEMEEATSTLTRRRKPSAEDP